MGNATEFETLVAPHFDALYRAAHRLTGRRHDAEDLVQEVCIRAFAELARLQTLESVRGWLLHVQYRVFVDGVRRGLRSPISPLTPDLEGTMAADAPDPEQSAAATDAQRGLHSAWVRLAKEQRALLALHAEGYDLTELHAITGLSKTALSARLHRARVRLAGLLKEYDACPPLARLEN